MQWIMKLLRTQNHPFKKELEPDVDISDLVARKDFVALKDEVDKLDINKLD